MPDTLWAALLLYPAWEAISGLDAELRRRSALRLGLTAETVPRSSTVTRGTVLLRGNVGTLVWRKYRGKPTPRMPWPVFLAMRLIYAVNERRSWNAATASRDRCRA